MIIWVDSAVFVFFDGGEKEATTASFYDLSQPFSHRLSTTFVTPILVMPALLGQSASVNGKCYQNVNYRNSNYVYNYGDYGNCSSVNQP